MYVYWTGARSLSEWNGEDAVPSTAVSSRKWTRAFYILTNITLIVGVGLSLLVKGYNLVQQTLALGQGGGRYFYIFIIVGAYVATVCLLMETTEGRV
jgi:hypothetical protein